MGVGVRVGVRMRMRMREAWVDPRGVGVHGIVGASLVTVGPALRRGVVTVPE